MQGKGSFLAAGEDFEADRERVRRIRLARVCCRPAEKEEEKKKGRKKKGTPADTYLIRRGFRLQE